MRALCLLLLCASLLCACRFDQTEKEFVQARAALLQKSMHADSAGLVQTRQRFEKLLQTERISRHDSLAAWTHYYIAFANWQLAFVTMGNRKEALQLVEGALAHLATATKLRENLPEAYAVMRRCQYWVFTLDRSRGRSIFAESNAALQKAQALASTHPVVMLEEAIDFFYKPPQAGGDQQKGAERFQAALREFEARKQMEPTQARWWQATAHMMYGQTHLALGKTEEAEQEFQAALKFEPNYDYVKSVMQPMTQLVNTPAVRNLSSAPWTLLARDSESDGVNPNWAAVNTLSYFYDAATDTVWFKFDLARLPNPHAFGINLVVDTDDDQSTGANWWGGNGAFTYDRLVSVWVVKSGAHAYRGAVGVGDFYGVTAGRYTNLARNNLAFRADSTQRMMLLGIKRAELDDDGRMRLIAAVGSHAGWNDDVPDSSSARLELK
ncbi:MAG: hypothetical protein AAB354_00685 [candidate division KSB1 bacterium]